MVSNLIGRSGSTLFILLFCFNGLDNILDLRFGNVELGASPLNDTDLHGLGSAVDNLEKSLNGQSDALVLREIVVVLFLEELPKGLGIAPPDNLRLPAGMSSSGIGLVQEGLVGIGLVSRHAGNQGGNSKGTHTSLLRVLLLDAGQVAADVVDAGVVFHGQAVRLCFHADLVDQDTSVGGEAGKGQDSALVDADDLADGAVVLQSTYG